LALPKNPVNCWDTLRVQAATAWSETTSANAEKVWNWAISSQASQKCGEGSTTSDKAYRVVPKSQSSRVRGCLTCGVSDTTLVAEVVMQGRRVVTKATSEEVWNAYKIAGTLEGAGKILGVSKKCVLNWMNKYNLERNKPVDPSIVAEMAKTMTSAEIAEKLGYSVTQINKIARVNGFKTVDNFHKGYATTHNGYQMKFSDGDRKSGYMLIHRAVMEESLGRKLNPNEVVHHANGDKTDNRIGNLVLMTRSDHARLHYLVTKPSPHKSRT
jgi:hypothetical protein